MTPPTTNASADRGRAPIKRSDIVGGRSSDDLTSDIAAAVTAGGGWIQVNFGGG